MKKKIIISLFIFFLIIFVMCIPIEIAYQDGPVEKIKLYYLLKYYCLYRTDISLLILVAVILIILYFIIKKKMKK